MGVDHIDLGAAAARGIPVAHTPGVLTDAVAELTFGLLLMLARRLPEAVAAVHQGRWQDAPLGTDVKGKTLLVVGLGRIGRAVADRALAFGMTVLFHDARDDLAAPPGVARVASLEEGLPRADVVTLHVDFNPSARHLIGASQLELLKPTALLINTSRGAVVDQEALSRALTTGRLAGAGLDVLQVEPPDPDDPILALPNVIVLPHIGSATRETRHAMIELAIANLLACLNHQKCEFIVNGVQPGEHDAARLGRA